MEFISCHLHLSIFSSDVKKFLLHILLFSLLPLAACVAILLSEPERKAVWTSSPDDCDNRGTFLYQRIFEDTTPIDIAFLGTSHTINGIQDTLITRLISEQHGMKLHAVNLGYCRFGSEMQYIIVKDLLAHKRPLLVLIEVNEEVGQGSHPMYPYYASTEDLVRPASAFNQSLPENFYNGFLARLTQIRSSVYGLQDSALPQFPPYGYRGYPDVASPQELVEPETNPEAPDHTWLGMSYSESWLSKTVELCYASLVKVRFVYIPAYHDQPHPMEGVDYFNYKAGLWVIPRDSIADKLQWRDRDHLNDAGAAAFSRWIASRIAETQLFGPYKP